MLWSIANFFQLLFTLTFSAVGISIALVLTFLTRRRDVAVFMARRIWAPGLLWGARGRLAVEGTERLAPDAAYLFVANHQSFIDIPVLFMALARPLHFVAKRELARVPFLGWYIRAMGMVFLDRRARRAARASVEEAAVLLRSGRSVVTFPEGARSPDGRVRPFKSGAFAAALEAGVAVVPVAIHGAGAVMASRGWRIRPGTIRVRIGEPIPPAGPEAERGALARKAEADLRRLYATLCETPAPAAASAAAVVHSD